MIRAATARRVREPAESGFAMAIDEAVTLKKLEVFLAFMKAGNMARVSEGLAQSVVSVHRALHSLEEGLRCPLFKREGRRLIPLQSAYVLEEYAQRMIGECEEGLRKAREAAGFASPRLKIGSLYSLTLGTIPRLLAGLKVRRSNLDVDLMLGSNRLLLDQLRQGRLDAIVIALREKIDEAELVSIALFTDDIFFATALDSRYARRKIVDLADLRDEKFVTLSDEFATGSNFNDAFQKAGFLPTVATQVGDIFSLINLVSGGVGYALLPGRVGLFSQRIRLIPLDKRYRAQQTITLLLPRKRERDPNLLALAAECRMLSLRRL